jgi:serine/threonine protein kinase
VSGFFPDEPDSLIGRVLGRKYELLSLLGAGSMGAVYRARHQTLKKDVAVKVLHSNVERSAKAIARFESEARAASRFEHANSVHILDFGQDEVGGLFYIVMEYLDGQDLRKLVLAEGPLDEKRACRIMAQVCAALAAAHDQGIIHRDMKPGNIMVINRIGDHGVKEEFVKICDFGIAKLSPRSDESISKEPLTLKGSFFGTPAYMSPEQAKGEPSDARSDVYACGLILWMLLAGERPFSGDTPMSVAMKQINEPLPSMDLFRTNLSLGVKELIRKATHKNPGLRFKSAREMCQVLQTYASESVSEVKAAAMMENLLSSDSLKTAVDDNPISATKLVSPVLVAATSLALGLVLAFFVISKVSSKDTDPVQNVAVLAPAPVTEFMGPPIPEKVYVTIEGVAEGTEVYSLGQLMGVAPGQIELVKDQQPIILVLKNDGYVTTSTKIMPTAGQTIVLTMKPKLRKLVPPKTIKRNKLRDRDQLENPFE